MHFDWLITSCASMVPFNSRFDDHVKHKRLIGVVPLQLKLPPMLSLNPARSF